MKAVRNINVPGFLLFMALSGEMQAQLQFITNNSAITITGYGGPGGPVVIPDSINGFPVTAIANHAFASWPTLTSITIPDTVVDIDTSAFASCSGLTNVTLGNGVTNIGVWCFQFCSSLRNISIPNSVSNIGDLAFSYCTSLTNVTIGTGLNTLGVSEFFFCTNLASIDVDLLNAAFASVGGVLFNKDQTALVQCPEAKTGGYIVPASVTSIGNNAFQYCAGLTNLIMPDTVTNIGEGAFYQCAKLAIPALSTNLVSIGRWAFQQCNGLTTVNLPEGLTDIGTAAFAESTKLTAITVSPLNPVYSSADGALFDKSQTTLIQFPAGRNGSYTISNGVTRIGDYAFDGCNKLIGVSIPAGVTNIGNVAFYGCSVLSSLVLPNVTSIGFGTFNYCGLRRIAIPDSVKTIGNFAFASCANLTNITLGSGITNMGDYVFTGCSNLKQIYFKGDAPSIGVMLMNGTPATVYYLPGTAGWVPTFGGRPTLLWNPTIQVADGNFGVRTNRFGFTISGSTNIPLVVEASVNPAGPGWVLLQSGTLTNGSIYFAEQGWTNYSSRYYRLRSP